MKKSLDDNDLDIETGEPKKKGGKAKVKKETPPATPNPMMPGQGMPGTGATPMVQSPAPMDTSLSSVPGTSRPSTPASVPGQTLYMNT